MATAGSPPVDGWVSLSLHAGASVDEIHRAAADPERLLIVEVSEKFPRTFGLPQHEHRIHVDNIDVLITSELEPLNLADTIATEAELAIAQLAMAFIQSGCTLQTGIGGIPNQIATAIAESNLEDLGIHSEMFTSGLMRIHQSGKVTNNKGSSFDGYSITTFAAGIPELYTWLHENDAVRFLPVHVVNSPELIAQNRNMVTINGALAVDLAGQVVADTIDGTQFSGVGGHEDFVSGPGLDSTDRSLICLPSTSTINGVLTSRIMGGFPAGSVVSTPRHQVDVIITEFGIAELEGRTIRERATALAEIAHPQFRDELLATAQKWPRD
jgi:acyl-CoA hydrolase